MIFNWRYYGDNNQLYYKPKPIQQRFKNASNKIFNNIYYFAAAKSIIKGKLNIAWKHFPHFLKNKNICRPDGKIILNPLSSPQYKIGYIKHYATKSTEEFALKIKKGTVNSKVKNLKKYLIKRINTFYFFLNKRTKKKKDLFKKILGINIKND